MGNAVGVGCGNTSKHVSFVSEPIAPLHNTSPRSSISPRVSVNGKRMSVLDMEKEREFLKELESRYMKDPTVQKQLSLGALMDTIEKDFHKKTGRTMNYFEKRILFG